ncbi:histidine phosphatase family protein [Paenibacillus thiaminolyticus]|uniref:histidine phosphatase family protein n=1 Tax=Paenibacillus thiaminolyticus TaxID=49283 RepID=UPI0035A5F031
MLPKKMLLLPLVFVTFLLLSGYHIEAGHLPKAENPSIVEALRNGGYILYMRHGEATIGQDLPHVIFDDCGTQRNLSELGKGQAQAIGQIMNKLNIPIQYPVWASPYCRTRDTARIAFGNQNVKVVPLLADIVKVSNQNVPAEEKQNIVANFTRMLETAPARGLNQIIIGHSFPAGTAIGEISYMGTAVIKPKGQGNGYEVIRIISLEQFMKAASDR